MLMPHGITFQTLDLEVDQRALIHSRSRITFLKLEAGTKYLALETDGIEVASPPEGSGEGSGDSVDRTNWGQVLYEHRFVMGINLNTSEYSAAPMSDLQSQTKQLCLIPASVSTNIFNDKISWQFLDSSLADVLDLLKQSLGRLILAWRHQGFSKKDNNLDYPEQRLPQCLMQASLVVSRLANSRGSVDDGMWALSWLPDSNHLIQQIDRAANMISSGLLLMDDATCTLNKYATLDCVMQDPSIPWSRVDFYAHPEHAAQLAFSNFLVNERSPSECVTDMGSVYLRLPSRCCKALMDTTANPSLVCPSLLVKNSAKISTLQNHDYQFNFVTSSKSSSKCVNTPLYGGDAMMGECELDLFQEGSPFAAVIGESSRVLPEIRGEKVPPPQPTKASSSPDFFGSLQSSPFISMVSMVVLSVIGMVINLLCCRCRASERGFLRINRHRRRSQNRAPSRASSADSRDSDPDPEVRHPSVAPVHHIRQLNVHHHHPSPLSATDFAPVPGTVGHNLKLAFMPNTAKIQELN